MDSGQIAGWLRHWISQGMTAVEAALQAHANFIETTQLVLILLYFVEQTGASPAVIHGFGASFVIARVAHAQGMSSTLGHSAGLAIWLIAYGVSSL